MLLEILYEQENVIGNIIWTRKCYWKYYMNEKMLLGILYEQENVIGNIIWTIKCYWKYYMNN